MLMYHIELEPKPPGPSMSKKPERDSVSCRATCSSLLDLGVDLIDQVLVVAFPPLISSTPDLFDAAQAACAGRNRPPPATAVEDGVPTV